MHGLAINSAVSTSFTSGHFHQLQKWESFISQGTTKMVNKVPSYSRIFCHFDSPIKAFQMIQMQYCFYRISSDCRI